MSFPPSNFKESISVVEGCVKDISDWMIVNKLKLNEDKTEVLLCNPKHLEVVDYVNEINIGNEKVVFSKKVKNLGVYFDESLSMESHINHLCKCLHLELRKIQHLSLFLDLIPSNSSLYHICFPNLIIVTSYFITCLMN